MSTTMAFVRMLSAMTRDKVIGQRVVPIVPDEARTFGMEGMFRQLGIYSSVGQLYEPVDHDEVMYYREDIRGQILEEGINEAGAMCSWIAAGTAYSNHALQMIPFFIFYSMFGFQRVGDLAWAAGDMRAQGFLLGGTSGRTTLAGEGLQHQDGHSLLQAATIPNCIAYDPTFAHELAVIIHSGLKRMYEQQDNVFYYITVMNENYGHPAMPEGAEEGIIRGIYQLQTHAKPQLQMLGSGAILREVIAAAALLESDFGIGANVWSVTSFNELRRDGLDCERWNMLHPEATPRTPYITAALAGHTGPVVAATDYIKTYADQVREFIPARYRVLGTDGFGRSDSRLKLREFFEVNRHYVVVAALKSLADEGVIPLATVSAAIAKYQINADKPNPTTV
jgi:pyruvate dehydrogenase E1 component